MGSGITRRTIYLSVLTLLVIASFAWIHKPTEDLPLVNSGFIQYQLKHAHIERANDRGEFTLQMDAADIQKSPTQEQIYLQMPALHYQDRQQTTWDVRAVSGELTPHSQRLTLHEQVKLAPSPVSDAKTVSHLSQAPTLETDHLTIDFLEQSAFTDSEVRLTTPTGHLNFSGLSIDLRRQQLHLKSNLHGTFTH